MDDFRNDLTRHLTALIDGGPAANPAEAVRALDALLAEHGSDMEPDLRHYLQRRSYHKARAFLRGELEPRHGHGTAP